MTKRLPQPLFKSRCLLNYSACERFLIGSLAGSTRFYDPQSFDQVLALPKAKGVIGSVFLPDGEHVLLAEYMHKVGKYRLQDGSLVGRKWKIVEKLLDVNSFLRAPNSEEVIHASWDGPPRVLDFSGNVVRRIGGRQGGPGVKGIAFSPDERLLAVTTDKAVWIYDWPSESLKQKVKVFFDSQNNPAEARHGQVAFFTNTQIVVRNGNGSTRQYDLAANETMFQFVFETEECYLRGHFSIYREQGIVAVQDGGKVGFYDLDSHRHLGSLTLHKHYANICGFSSRHGTLIAEVNETCRVYSTSEILNSLEG